MKLHAMDPTEENVIGRFCDDKIGRNADVLQFVALLGKIRENASISVDAPWGAGKTFFVKQVKLVLDSCNDFSTLSKETKTRVAKACEQALAEKDVRGEPQVCVYYDAWANDNDEDPILSLVYSILKESGVNPSLKINEKQPLLTILEQLAEMITGRPIKQFFDAIKSVDSLSAIKDTKSICTLVNEFFDSLLPEKGNRLVIIIDELDRCRPDFAVRLLERIKHYFVNDKITFVFSVNSHQLQHTIKRHYGDGFDAARYLDRFFDLRIDLPPADMQKFYQSIGLKDGHWVYEQVCREMAEYFNMQMRESTHFYKMAKIAAYRPTHDTVEHVYPLKTEGLFCMMVLTPLLIGLKMTNQEGYKKFVSGEDGGVLINIVKGKGSACQYCTELLAASDETFQKTSEKDARKLVALDERVGEVYKAIFQHDYRTSPQCQVGQMTFYQESKNDLLKTVSGLSPYADYSL